VAAPDGVLPEGDVEVMRVVGVSGAGWRLSGAEDRRLPVRGGASSSPRLVRRSGGGAPAVHSMLVVVDGIQEGCLAFLLYVLGLSVRCLL
jgi:hypothetical protein